VFFHGNLVLFEWILMFFIVGIIVFGSDYCVVSACILVFRWIIVFPIGILFFLHGFLCTSLGILGFGTDSSVLSVCILVFLMDYCVFPWESCFFAWVLIFFSWEFLFSVRIIVFCQFAFLCF